MEFTEIFKCHLQYKMDTKISLQSHIVELSRSMVIHKQTSFLTHSMLYVLSSKV